MSEVYRYAAILRKSRHIQHTFDTFDEAKGWMEATKESGLIAVVVAEVKVLAKIIKSSDELIEFAKKFDGKVEP